MTNSELTASMFLHEFKFVKEPYAVQELMDRLPGTEWDRIEKRSRVLVKRILVKAGIMEKEV